MLKIKVFLCSVFMFFLSRESHGQTDPVQEVTYHFVLKNNILSGPGADTLKIKISGSQFFLIGEEHDMTELQMLTAHLMPFLKNNGYRNFAVEIGSSAADKLSYIYHHKGSLMEFNSKYYKYFNSGPFGFFDGKEEEVFLNSALNNGLKLWGIDYENHGAPLYILDELYAKGSKNMALKQAYQQARTYVIQEYAKDSTLKKHLVYAKMLESSEIKSFFKLLPHRQEVKKLQNDLLTSWKIRNQETLNNWYARVNNMKQSFIGQYKNEVKNEKSPKVFIKMGAVHTAKGTSSSGFQEVGNTIYELANYSGTRVFSVLSFARYRKDEQGNITDLLEPEDKELLKYTEENSWSLIDLKKLEIARWQGRIKLSKTVREYIERYDMILIPPATKRMQSNFIR
eukprot:gene11738-13698_t